MEFNSDLKEELKNIAYEPAKLLLEKLEKNYDQLNIEQKMDFEKLKFGLKMYDLELEKRKQQRNGGYRWA
jgi:hypothetical protein